MLEALNARAAAAAAVHAERCCDSAGDPPICTKFAAAFPKRSNVARLMAPPPPQWLPSQPRRTVASKVVCTLWQHCVCIHGERSAARMDANLHVLPVVI